MIRGFRLSTLMLLIVIAALVSALVVQHNWASGRIAVLRAAVDGPTWKMIDENSSNEVVINRLKQRVKELESKIKKGQ